MCPYKSTHKRSSGGRNGKSNGINAMLCYETKQWKLSVRPPMFLPCFFLYDHDDIISIVTLPRSMTQLHVTVRMRSSLPNAKTQKRLDYRLYTCRNVYHEPMVFPPQSGIFNPGFNFRPGSIKPHLSSHSLPGVFKVTFHGSSNASNLQDDRSDKLPPCMYFNELNGPYQKKFVPLARL